MTDAGVGAGESKGGCGGEFAIREANEADRDGILAISGELIYGGHDYLPLTLDRYLADGLRKVFVAVIKKGEDEEVVGLDSVVVLPFPATAPSLLFQALRTRPDQQGKGIASALTAACLAHVDAVRTDPACFGLDASPQLLRITTLPRSKSVAMHERRGYAIVRQPDALPEASSEFEVEWIEAPALGAELYDGAAAESSELAAIRSDASILVSDWVPLTGCTATLEALAMPNGVASAMEPHVFAAARDRATGALRGFVHIADSPRHNGLELYAAVYATSAEVTTALLRTVYITAFERSETEFSYISSFYPDAHRASVKEAFTPALTIGRGPGAKARKVYYVDSKFDNTGGMVVLEKKFD
ncbi:uncharacterized protein AMSG_08604 [Thecamonas trahens ATCC 50062]|uniref:N-acetyltransferase domain-containing protein n=1 Tax=Thecamonas trahens ATCC 50062 TaxID=461836 RepID=A0A0L0DJZ1_THETB|nr:hypothetical protein AMSG_08604 [Thecamonas trahens ATCC 50062]KNC52724.1 hypothetical protein AMSG_08604 [Thecamonas trahens ATCC 50062]|eukprot:XP_013755038.1 hypothetical protein AMSG_08604 [Thecamonas trahens ATCC 50062]